MEQRAGINLDTIVTYELTETPFAISGNKGNQNIQKVLLSRDNGLHFYSVGQIF